MFKTLELHPSLSHVINQYQTISIFAIYFVIIGLLCFRCVSIIFAHSRPASEKPQKHESLYTIYLFACFAVASLVATWYFMISFLIQSYRDWAMEHPDSALGLLAQLRGWLDETYLFEQAWAAIIETEPRFWWTIQIFGFASIWSVFLGIEGLKYRISGIWVFMVLGQLVAISFAANLSFLLVLLARRRSKPSQETRCGLGPHFTAMISFACAAFTRIVHGDKRFIIVLLVPHIMAFAPMTPWLRPNSSVYYTVILLATSLLAHTTWQAIENGWTASDFAVALYEYPAVSSAGWDVIWCWISFTAWILVN